MSPKINQSVLQIGCLLSLVALSGCGTLNKKATYYPDAPISQNYPVQHQGKLNAASHWNIVANDLSAQLVIKLDKNKLSDKPVYLNLHSDKTQFTEAFNDFLTTSLVNKGVLVSKRRSNSIIYNYKIQALKYNSYRSTTMPSRTLWMPLAAGLVVVRHITDQLHFKAIDEAILGAGLLSDAFSTELQGLAPKVELLITSSILSHDIYLYRTSDIYYANSSDMHFYQKKAKTKDSDVFKDPFYTKSYH